MKLRVVLSMVLAMGIFASCATVSVVPAVSEAAGVGMTLFYSECSIENFDDVFVSYDLVFEEGKTIRIDPTKKYTINKDLAPGKHVLKEIRMLNKSDASPTQTFPLGIEFTVEAGSLTVFPVAMALLRTIDGNYITIYSRMGVLTEPYYEAISKYFYGLPNSKDWKIIRVEMPAK